MTHEVYMIEGMSCAACSSAVERVTRKLPGVVRSDVNLTTTKMDIEYDEAQVDSKTIIAKVEKAGFGAKLLVEGTAKKKEKTDGPDADELDLKRRLHNLIGAAIFCVLVMYVSMGHMIHLSLPGFCSRDTQPINYALTQMILAIPALYFGRDFFIRGYKALFHGNPNMDSLVAIGSSVSFIHSVIMTYLLSYSVDYVNQLYFESSAMVLTLIMLGKYFEARSKKKTKGAIKLLMELTPETALKVDGDTVREVSSDELFPGDIVLVKPGAKIPADAKITSGNISVDESMLTGESLPIDKTVGDMITGGSINTSGACYAEVLRVGQDSTLAGIIRIVEEAQGKKAPISRLADKVAGIFVPTVISIAVVAAVIWIIAGQNASFVLRVFTSVLVVACPCALGLATPTAIMVGTGLGASNGILIRSGESLETSHDVTAVVLDKTGTVTEGKPIVTDIIGDDETEILKLCASCEARSEHPTAKAVMAKAEGMELYEVAEFSNLAGVGVTCTLNDGRKVTAGSHRTLSDTDAKKFADSAKALADKGCTLVYVNLNDVCVGIIGVADKIKDDSAEAIQKMHSAGLKVFLLTGDNKAAAEHVGKVVGVDRVFSEVLPQDKASIVENLQNEGYKVMMVGDGINDAPALVKADVGAAIGAGSDIAIESGDIVLMRSSLQDVYKSIRLSRLTIKTIKENLFWAFFYNTIGIPIAAGVLYPALHILLNPMFCGLAMSLSSVFVVSNALRLRRKKL